MRIDRSNYEIWLIDWLDGNLSDLQVEQLQHFLNENPDLKEEFDELWGFRLTPSGKSYPQKNKLMRTTANLSGSQFEYLAVAHLENDLSAEHLTELNDAMRDDPDKKMTFELIQKIKLSSSDIKYKYKSRLTRRTITQKVIWLSLVGLSAAAIITIALVTYFSKPETLQLKSEKTAEIVVGNPAHKADQEKVSNGQKTNRHSVVHEKQYQNLLAVSPKDSSYISETDINPSQQNDSLTKSAYPPSARINNIPLLQNISFEREAVPNSLIALNTTVTAPESDDDRSKLRKFIAKTFREKIMKEKSPKDSPLRIYEIAEAGVTELNKLLGWEMALDERKDGNGELKSVYFSSKILKFNAPVKKSEPVQ